MLYMMVERWQIMVRMLSWLSEAMKCSTVGDVYVNVCVWQNNISYRKVEFSQPYFKQPLYSEYKLYPAKSLAEMNPTMVYREKQHLGGALRRQASCCLLCKKTLLMIHTPAIFALWLKALYFYFEMKYFDTSSSCAYLARSELLQSQGRTPGQGSISH